MLTKRSDGTVSMTFTLHLRDWYTWGPCQSDFAGQLHYYGMAREIPIIGAYDVDPIQLP